MARDALRADAQGCSEFASDALYDNAVGRGAHLASGFSEVEAIRCFRKALWTMTYLQLAYLHLLLVVPAFALGTWLLLRRKGTANHRLLGRIYLVLMALTALITLMMPALVGPRWLGHFGYIHLLSVFTLTVVPRAYLAARRHDVRSHRRSMIGLYFGALILAGGLAFSPGRLLHGWLFGA